MSVWLWEVLDSRSSPALPQGTGYERDRGDPKLTIQEYISGLEAWKAEVVRALADLVLEAVPEATASIKWSQPVFELGGPFCYIKPAKNHINLGFWWGVKMDDPEGLIQGTGEKMRHIKINGLEEVKPENLVPYVRQSAELNQKLGNPTRTKA